MGLQRRLALKGQALHIGGLHIAGRKKGRGVGIAKITQALRHPAGFVQAAGVATDA